jgi:hypothetical protein
VLIGQILILVAWNIFIFYVPSLFHKEILLIVWSYTCACFPYITFLPLDMFS